MDSILDIVNQELGKLNVSLNLSEQETAADPNRTKVAENTIS